MQVKAGNYAQHAEWNLNEMGSFNNHMDIILLFFDHPPTSVDIFHEVIVDKNGKF